MFNAGGRVPVYAQYDGGNPGYKTEYNNFAPNVGVAWQPNVQGGWLRALLGDPDLATRARELRRRLQQRWPELLHATSTTPIPAAR